MTYTDFPLLIALTVASAVPEELIVNVPLVFRLPGSDCVAKVPAPVTDFSQALLEFAPLTQLKVPTLFEPEENDDYLCLIMPIQIR